MSFASHLRVRRLGEFTVGTDLLRSESLALVQVILLYHLVSARAALAVGGLPGRSEPARRRGRTARCTRSGTIVGHKRTLYALRLSHGRDPHPARGVPRCRPARIGDRGGRGARRDAAVRVGRGRRARARARRRADRARGAHAAPDARRRRVRAVRRRRPRPARAGRARRARGGRARGADAAHQRGHDRRRVPAPAAHPGLPRALPRPRDQPRRRQPRRRLPAPRRPRGRRRDHRPRARGRPARRPAVHGQRVGAHHDAGRRARQAPLGRDGGARRRGPGSSASRARARGSCARTTSPSTASARACSRSAPTARSSRRRGSASGSRCSRARRSSSSSGSGCSRRSARAAGCRTAPGTSCARRPGRSATSSTRSWPTSSRRLRTTPSRAPATPGPSGRPLRRAAPERRRPAITEGRCAICSGSERANLHAAEDRPRGGVPRNRIETARCRRGYAPTCGRLWSSADAAALRRALSRVRGRCAQSRSGACATDRCPRCGRQPRRRPVARSSLALRVLSGGAAAPAAR